MLNYGHSPYIPVSVLPNHRVPAASEFIQRMQRQITDARLMPRSANARRRDVQYNPGDWVLLSSKNLRFKRGTPKFLPRWVGPFQVARRVGQQAYELVLPARWKIHDVFHVSLLEGYQRDGSVQPPPPAELLEGEEEYEVADILDHRSRTQSHGAPQYEYLVSWVGCLPENNTWEPQGRLINAPELLKRYWQTVNQRAG